MSATLESSRATTALLEARLQRWRREIPLYRRATAATPNGSLSTAFPALRDLPLITKHDIRQNFPRNFLPAGVELETLLAADTVELEHTSGTSEERTPLLLPRGWWAEQEARALRLNGRIAAVLDEFPAARRVTIVSPVCNGDIRYQGRPSAADRVVGQALFVNLSRHPFLWSEADLARMAAETVDWAPQFLDVDPVYGVRFALYCEQHGLRFPSLRFVLASYEFISVVHRRVLERVFGVPVFNLYGATETGHLLLEDQHGTMRPSQGTAWLDLLDPDPRGVGDLIVSTLTNEFMPLLRYRIGDLVERRGPAESPEFVVHGRVLDAFTTPDGRRVTTRDVDGCFTEVTGMAHYQLRQRADGTWLLRFVPEGAGPAPPELRQLRERLAGPLGAAASVMLAATDALMPESSGKFRLGYPARAL